MARETYVDGLLEGKAETYYPNGKLASVEFWKDDLQEDSAWYFHSNGSLHRKGRYESGVYQGQWLMYFPNQVAEQQISYADGLPNGESKNWNETGILIESGHYSFGKKDGQFIFFHPKTGKVSSISAYEMDQPKGLWIYFNRHEKIIRKEWH